MLNLRIFLFASILITLTTLLYAADKPRPDFYSKPEAIISEVKLHGAKSVVVDLTKDWNVWDSICDKVSTGDKTWLKAAVALQPGTDAGSSETMDLALGEALEHNPENVFRIAIPVFEIESICSGPDVDSTRYDSYELSLKAINLRIKKVAAVKDPKFKRMSKECINHLEESRKGVAEFYEVNKKK